MKPYFLFLGLSSMLFSVVPVDNICSISIAKSGTHLTTKAIKLLTRYEYCQSKYGEKGSCLKHKNCENYLFTHFYHVDFTAEDARNQRINPVENPNRKYIVTVRDLRAVLVSASNYYSEFPIVRTYNHYNKHENEDFKEETYLWLQELNNQWLTNKENKWLTKNVELLLDTEQYVADTILDIRNGVRWLKTFNEVSKDQILIVHFEDLVGPRGGGSKVRQLKAFQEIADFLEVKVSKRAINILANLLWGSAGTFSQGRNRGKTTAYTRYFTKDCEKKFWSLLSEEMYYLGYSK